MGMMTIVGVALLFAGILGGRAFTANFELDTLGKVRKGIGVSIAVVGALLALRGAGLIGAPVHAEGGAEVAWRTELGAAESEARAQGRPLMVDFSAEWCKACKELEAHTFSAPEVAPRLAKWVTVRVDMTDDRPEHAPMRERFKIQGLPTVAFLDAQGQWLESLTLTGFEPPKDFLARLDLAESGGSGEGGSLADRIKAGLAGGSVWVYLLVFLAGLVASLSPCVYPLIPITLSLFGARGATSRLRGFLLSVVYVLGITVTYSALGVLAATTGGLFGAALQSAWVVGGIALVFFAMGLSMVGVFELGLPDGLNQKLNDLGGGEGGRFLTAFLMGTVAGVIAAPCVGPPLVAVLAFVAQQGSISTGVSLLSVYSLGMGMLFIVLGTFTQFLTRMPKSGGWMEVVKGSLGMVMLVVALVYANDIVPFLP